MVLSTFSSFPPTREPPVTSPTANAVLKSVQRPERRTRQWSMTLQDSSATRAAGSIFCTGPIWRLALCQVRLVLVADVELPVTLERVLGHAERVGHGYLRGAGSDQQLSARPFRVRAAGAASGRAGPRPSPWRGKAPQLAREVIPRRICQRRH
jgi:hypothetical protein